jgi:uncharacterized C2H2 Zn-finger protein
MALGVALEALVPTVVIVVIVGILVLMTRGRMLKCPDCGSVFTAPAMDRKRSGMGFTLPFMGSVKCPKCGESRPRRDYQKPPPVQRLQQ